MTDRLIKKYIMSPRTAQQFEEMRESKMQIIAETALELFGKFGYHNTSVSQIAKSTGMSKGLLYNYFDSKEQLLEFIVSQATEETFKMINPDSDNEITTKEMSDFIDNIIFSLKSRNQYWKLYFQISTQQEAFEFLRMKADSDKSQKFSQLLYKYFSKRFENPIAEMLVFSSVMKGFSIQYAFAADMFPDEHVKVFAERIKKDFVKEEIEVKNNS